MRRCIRPPRHSLNTHASTHFAALRSCPDEASKMSIKTSQVYPQSPQPTDQKERERERKRGPSGEVRQNSTSN